MPNIDQTRAPQHLPTSTVEALKRLLGSDAVLDEGAGLAEFHDPFEGPGARDHQPSVVVQPSSVEEVQAVLRVAGEQRFHIWTSSMGRNYGYGGSAPVVNGAVVLNFRRMNRILEIDARQGHVLIEPGVSFRQLYDALRADDVPLMMSVPDLGWGSIIGNALDHGYGYGVWGDHAGALCGLEVVLPGGDLLRTGQGAIPGSPLWSSHRRGFGPSLDELFKQSNFGVVTKAGLWLMPRPEQFVIGTIQCMKTTDIVPLIETLRSLLQAGVLQGIPMIVGTPGDDEAVETGQAPFTLANIKTVLRPGRWNVRLGLYGHAGMIAARRALLEHAIAAIPGAEPELRTYPGTAGPDEVEPRDYISAGIPNQLLLERLRGVFGQSFGHMDFSPVLPCTGEAALRLDRAVREVSARYGLIGPVGMLLNQRSMVAACMLMFDAGNPARVAAARTAMAELYGQAAEWGCAPYRAHVALADQALGIFGYNDHALARTYGRIKDALDPAGLLSPGNHGIWPGRPAS
ncbi:FAD-binding oxidoreductase [Sphingobium lignivorans]|uniref:4-cresol dehydrogenase (Hydroxylating) n=1 Tax=Sphingobium lignivorans TaxID=2735886 RepID=A0ABR6NCV2_9SPHN|nr:FAD-binding oxidoreductase [Sphingobium lignivorans]MBB5985098.1 4-cresol dehydrogenase (hydroxylating) [Sphingobium lignivorans]